MNVIKKSQTIKHQNSANCFAFEYPSENKNINGAVIELSGRYPDSGEVFNIACTELAYVLEGEGVVIVEGNETSISQGDMIIIEPNKKYVWEGRLKLFISSTPAWSPEQHKKA